MAGPLGRGQTFETSVSEAGRAASLDDETASGAGAGERGAEGRRALVKRELRGSTGNEGCTATRLVLPHNNI